MKKESKANGKKSDIWKGQETRLKYLIIQDEAATLIDDFSVRYQGPYQLEKGQLMVESQARFHKLSISKLHEDTLLVDSVAFIKIDSRPTTPFSIELMGFQTAEFLDFEQRRFQSIVSARRDEKGELELKLGDKRTDVRDLPLYLERRHLHKPLEVVLFLDTSLSFDHLKELYFWLDQSHGNRVSLVTYSQAIDQYEVLRDRIEVWEEDRSAFREYANAPPFPSGPSRREFIKTVPVSNIVQADNETHLSNFRNGIKTEKGNWLITVNVLPSILEYIKLKLMVQKAINQLSVEKAKESYGLSFDQLTPLQKREVKQRLPIVRFDMRWNK